MKGRTLLPILLILIQVFLMQGLHGNRDPVLVRGLEFRHSALQGGRDPWLEVRVILLGGVNPVPGARHPQFNEAVKVRLSLATRAGRAADGEIAFYRSAVELAALEARQIVTVHFYLPPEIVKRDRLAPAPLAALVELESNGRPLPFRREHAAGVLVDEEQAARFRERVSREAVATDGVLLPIYHTPFYAPVQRERLERDPSYRRMPSGVIRQDSGR